MKKTGFYKKIGLVIAATAVIGLAGCNSGGGGTEETSSQEPASSSTVASSSTETTDSSSAESVDVATAYENINVGDSLNGGEGGTELKDVTEMLGDPDDTEKGGEGDTTTDVATWNNVDGADMVMVTFVDDKAVSKVVQGLEVADHDAITMEQYDAVTTDGDYTLDQAVEAFGDPDSKEASLEDGKVKEMYSWTTNVDGSDDAAITIEFVDGAATTKNNTGME